ncbi:uncharacterized protein LOC107367366 isoform X2 [Tetranychus urticae]|uniref:uncharacterized protein LOC107367366 isoform X2 n=1 Tax=Tetranychus urticae TaxID=32264 RepID=UPI00077BB1A3|nr:uncharacterized protein LOC107367366 isoform X2 [Tetranychus urticae]
MGKGQLDWQENKDVYKPCFAFHFSYIKGNLNSQLFIIIIIYSKQSTSKFIFNQLLTKHYQFIMMFKAPLFVLAFILAVGLVVGQKGGFKSDRYIQQQQYPYYSGKTSPYMVQSPMNQYRYPYAPPLSPIEQRRAQLLMRNIGGYDDDSRYSQYSVDNYDP